MNSVTHPLSSNTGSAAFWLPIWTLTWRELLRFFRQRTRIVGALGQPLIFWVLFGAGLRGSFAAPQWAPRGMTYQEYFFPGVTVMIVLFTAIFSTILIIEDRREGFLQRVLVAPVSRLALVAFTLTALGFLMAWSLDSTQGFRALMSVFLMPMWLLSGSFFPVPESGWLSWVMRLNPLTYGVAGLRGLMSPALFEAAANPSLP